MPPQSVPVFKEGIGWFSPVGGLSTWQLKTSGVATAPAPSLTSSSPISSRGSLSPEVVDCTDIREIVTAACYRPDGKIICKFKGVFLWKPRRRKRRERLSSLRNRKRRKSLPREKGRPEIC